MEGSEGFYPTVGDMLKSTPNAVCKEVVNRYSRPSTSPSFSFKSRMLQNIITKCYPLIWQYLRRLMCEYLAFFIRVSHISSILKLTYTTCAFSVLRVRGNSNFRFAIFFILYLLRSSTSCLVNCLSHPLDTVNNKANVDIGHSNGSKNVLLEQKAG